MESVEIYSLTDFMDACNDQIIDLEGNWVSYVFVGKVQSQNGVSYNNFAAVAEAAAKI